MNIGIAIHSESGHTANLARAIAAEWRAMGHEATVELLRTHGAVKPSSRHVEFRRLPEFENVDAILVGGPIWAFSASPVVMSYIRTFETLKGKKVLNFLTHGLPFTFLEKRALKQMNDAFDCTGAQILEGEAMVYFFPKQEAIDAVAKKICGKLLEK
jgi:NAD(P)H dehydrogenase (quinone)